MASLLLTCSPISMVSRLNARSASTLPRTPWGLMGCGGEAPNKSSKCRCQFQKMCACSVGVTSSTRWQHICCQAKAGNVQRFGWPCYVGWFLVAGSMGSLATWDNAGGAAAAAYANDMHQLMHSGHSVSYNSVLYGSALPDKRASLACGSCTTHMKFSGSCSL